MGRSMELSGRPGYNGAHSGTSGRGFTTMTIPKILSAEYSLSVHRVDQCPPGELPEVAFLGRSNVGKSSLINSLLGRKKLVRTSSRPGCTRALNFFLINQRWNFVDLPGFGYAAVAKDVKASWGPLVLGVPGAAGVFGRGSLSPGWPKGSGLGGVIPLGISQGTGAPGDPGPDQGRQIEAGGAEPPAQTLWRSSHVPGG